MVMRVTNGMMTDQVVYNLQRSMRRYLDLQTNMSSGRRINKPSDDPLGTLRDLDYRQELSKIEQFQRNISQGQNWLKTYDTTLSDVKDLLSEAREIAVSMSNDTYDAAARQASAEEVQSIIDQVLRLANTQIDGRNMFSGYKTRTQPLDLSSNGCIYRGDDGGIEFEIESGMRETVNVTGPQMFLKSFGVLGGDSDLNVGVTSNTPLADLNGGDGVDLTTGTFTITDLNRTGVSVTIDLNTAPPATTVGEALAKINAQLTAAGMNGTVTLGISESGNALEFDTTNTGIISTATSLARLYAGAGLGAKPGHIGISDGAGINVNVDLTGAETIGDIITACNTQLAASGVTNVTVGINGAGTGLQITDTNLPPLGLTVSNASVDDKTAENLGIIGSVGASLSGLALDPEAAIEVTETTGTTAADLGMLGTFHHDANGEDIDPRLNANSRLTDWFNGLGAGSDSMVFWQGERSFTLDLGDPSLVSVQDVLDAINNSGLDVTASINTAGTGIQVANNDTYRSFSIEEVDNGRAAKRTGLFGASDTMSTLVVLNNALENNDAEALTMLLDELDDAIGAALENRANVGARSMRLEITSSRLTDLKLNFTSLLSDVEDADMTQVVTDLATQETMYQAALAAAGKIIQPSLLDFLD